MLTVYLGFIIFLSYIITISIKNKNIPNSISDTYYMGGRVWFTLSCIISSLLIMSGLLDLTDGSMWQFISFIAPAGLAFIGVSPKFKDLGLESKVHYISAFILLIGSQLWLLVFGNVSVLYLWLSMIYFIFTKQRIFYCEMLCIITFLLGFVR